MICIGNYRGILCFPTATLIYYAVWQDTIVSIAYGPDVEPENDPYVRIAKGQNAITAAAVLGAFLVDALPIIKYGCQEQDSKRKREHGENQGRP